MYLTSTWNLRNTVSSVLAAAIVAVSGLTLDRGLERDLPRGIVEVGELESVDFLPRVAMLPNEEANAPRVALSESRSGG